MPTRRTAFLVGLALVAASCITAGEAPSTTASPGPTTTSQPVSTSSTEPPAPTSSLAEVVPASFEVFQSDLARLVPAADPQDVRAVTDGDFRFGMDLLGEVAGGDNFMVSPYSVATALSMLYAGAEGVTAEEIAAVLHLTVDEEALHEVRNAIDAALLAEAPTGADETRPFTIRPANSAWGQLGFPFEEAYLDTLATHYGAGMYGLDFAADPDAARHAINGWVEEATEDRIEDLLPSGSFDGATVLVLVNAIWFYASWDGTFPLDQTEPGLFVLMDGTEVSVPFMHAGGNRWMADTESFTAVRLPYVGDAAMVVVVPKEGTPAELAAGLDPADFRYTWPEPGIWRNQKVNLALPRFGFEATVELDAALVSLGMATAFSPDANLSGISSGGGLFVGDAFHKTFVAVDEFGTEAAAATALTIFLSGSEPVDFVVDRPFLFFIEHEPTGEVLFLGQVADPR